MSTLELKHSLLEPTTKAKVKRYLYVDVTVFIALVVLTVVGVGINDYSALEGFRYWTAMAILLAIANAAREGLRIRHQEWKQVSALLWRLALHWGALFIALYILFLLQGDAGRLNNAGAGLVALLAVALATFTAGVHFDWRFTLIGTLLGVGVIAMALFEEYLWIMLLAASLILCIGIGVVWWRHKSRSAV